MVKVLSDGFKVLVQIPITTLFCFLKYFVETILKNDTFTYLK